MQDLVAYFNSKRKSYQTFFESLKITINQVGIQTVKQIDIQFNNAYQMFKSSQVSHQILHQTLTRLSQERQIHFENILNTICESIRYQFKTYLQRNHQLPFQPPQIEHQKPLIFAQPIISVKEQVKLSPFNTNTENLINVGYKKGDVQGFKIIKTQSQDFSKESLKDLSEVESKNEGESNFQKIKEVSMNKSKQYSTAGTVQFNKREIIMRDEKKVNGIVKAQQSGMVKAQQSGMMKAQKERPKYSWNDNHNQVYYHSHDQKLNENLTQNERKEDTKVACLQLDRKIYKEATEYLLRSESKKKYQTHNNLSPSRPNHNYCEESQLVENSPITNFKLNEN